MRKVRPPEWEKAFEAQDELNRIHAQVLESRENAIPRPRRVSRLERWFQTFIQALILTASGFVVWAVACGGWGR